MYWGFFAFILSLWAAPFALAQQQHVVVGLYDGPVDYESPFLKNNLLEIDAAKVLQWTNDVELEALHREEKRLSALIADGWAYRRLSRFDRNSLSRAHRTLHHGTLVAELLVQGSDALKLVNVSSGIRRFYTREFLRARVFKPHKYSNDAKVFGEISAAIQKTGARVFNISTGWSEKLNFQSKSSALGWLGTFFYRSDLLQLSREFAMSKRQEFLKVLRANPQTIFVVSAGNTSDWLGNGTIDVKNLREPNMVVVGSVELDGSWSRFSNYGESFVDVAALGSDYISKNPSSGFDVEHKGTSISAPLVAHRLASILAENPKFTNQQAIEALYTMHTERNPKLSHFVNQGRVLKVSAEERIKIGATGKFWRLKQCEKEFE